MANRTFSVEILQGSYRETLETMGQRIAAARLKRGLTQAELSEKLMMSRGTIALWESGTVFPGTAAIFGIAQVLNTTTRYLIANDKDGSDGLDNISIPIVQYQGTDEVFVSSLLFSPRLIDNAPPKSYVDLRVYMITGDMANPRYKINDMVVFNKQNHDTGSGGSFLYRSGTTLRVGDIKTRFGDNIILINDEDRIETTIGEMAPHIVGKIVTHIHKM